MDKNNILSWGVFVHTNEMVLLAYAGAGVARRPLGRVGGKWREPHLSCATRVAASHNYAGGNASSSSDGS